MRTTVRLKDALFDQAKSEAERRGITFTALLEASLMRELAQSNGASKRRRVVLPLSNTRGGPWPGIDLNNTAQLMDIMDGIK